MSQTTWRQSTIRITEELRSTKASDCWLLDACIWIQDRWQDTDQNHAHSSEQAETVETEVIVRKPTIKSVKKQETDCKIQDISQDVKGSIKINARKCAVFRRLTEQ